MKVTIIYRGEEGNRVKGVFEASMDQMVTLAAWVDEQGEWSE